MKNTIRPIILALILSIPFVGIAQDNAKPKPKSSGHDNYRWEIGLNGGVNLTNVQGFDHNNIDPRIGRLYGMTVIYHFSKVVSLKTDIDFENKGWVLNNYEINTPDGLGGQTPSLQNITQNLDYFDIPAFLHIGFGRKLKFDINFGPYFAFLVQNKAFYLDGDGNEVQVNEAAFTGYNNFDFGLTYGGGIDYAISDRVSFGFDVLYEQGLLAIKSGNIKNQSLDFDIGVNFLFGKKK